MKIVVGLGNPGKKYWHTRHNVGFLALDFFAKTLDFEVSDFKLEKKFETEILDPSKTKGGQDTLSRFLLAKPQTFMNDSGRAIKAICEFYKINKLENLLVIHDEVDLPFGTVRHTASASAAGHKGVQNLIEQIGSQNFQRLRIGVETRLNKAEPPTDAFVLQNFSPEELVRLEVKLFLNVNEQIKKFLTTTK